MTSAVQAPRETLLDPDLIDLSLLLKQESSLPKKLSIIKDFKAVQAFSSKNSSLQNFFQKGSDLEKMVLYSVIATGQGKIFSGMGKKDLELFLADLLPVEQFYQEIGGIVGYHVCCLELLAQKQEKKRKGTYHPPKALEISQENPFVCKATLSGIRHLEQLAEMYPLGGAADRLCLRDEETGDFLSAVTLEFCGRTLLERLIDDLQAREFIYFKLFGKQVRVPVAMMTSHEKCNDAKVRQIFREKNWLGRREEDFFLFSQPLVPAMNKKGMWCLLKSKRLLLKPGGHGAIWKLARDLKVLEWFRKKGAKKALMRQINNLVAGVDYGLLAFLGVGFEKDKEFGFAACPRAKGLSEGVNVVIETEEGCCLTNIEYCDFERFQIDEKGGGEFLANTNLLFVDIDAIERLTDSNPIPGKLVNAKKIKYRDLSGKYVEEEVLRLESTMQNIADSLVEPKEHFSDTQSMEKSFITSNRRNKTISTIKKEFAFGSSMLQTPEQCFLDFLENARDLLINYCKMQVPKLGDPMNFFLHGPSFIFLYHPSLGPLYQIIAQKMRSGRLALGSEVQLQISELYAENLDVDGSLHVLTDAIMGHKDEKGYLQYSHQMGKCVLKNVRVRNSGIHREASRCFWKDEIVHKEKCEIFIEEGGEFYAENVFLRGDLRICVPSGVKVTAFMNEGRLEFSQEVLSEPSWFWNYSIDSKNHVGIKKSE